MSLDPHARALLEMLARGTETPFHMLSAERARLESAKLHRACGAAPRQDVAVSEIRIAAADGHTIAARSYRPTSAPAGRALAGLVYFHGGGWTIGSLDSYDSFCRHLAAASACVVISVEYRLAPESPFPAALDDAWSSLCWVASEATRLGIDSRRLAVGGDSAGGNLAAVVALMARDTAGPQLCFQLLVYPATDLTSERDSLQRYGTGYFLEAATLARFHEYYVPAPHERTDWRVSPLLAADHGRLPPTLLVTAGYDPLTDDCLAYAERLRACSVAVEHLHYEDLIHGFLTLGGAIPKAGAVIEVLAGKLSLGLDASRARVTR